MNAQPAASWDGHWNASHTLYRMQGYAVHRGMTNAGRRQDGVGQTLLPYILYTNIASQLRKNFTYAWMVVNPLGR